MKTHFCFDDTDGDNIGDVRSIDRLDYRMEFYCPDCDREDQISSFCIDGLSVTVINLDDGGYLEVDGEVDSNWVEERISVIANLSYDLICESFS